MTTGSLDGPAKSASPARRKLPRGRRIAALSKRDKVLVALMLGIPLAADLLFIWLPAVATVGLSFTSWDNLGGFSSIKMTGLANYKFAAQTDPQFWPAVEHNIIWLLVFVCVATPLGMLFAVIIDRNIRGSRIYQSVLFLPVMLSLALIGIIWELIYSPNYGLINSIIGRTGNNDAIDWLGNSHTNLWAVLVEASWRQAGYVMVLYLAGLKAVDPTLREAAQMDGAGAWMTFRKVIFPVMKPINIVILVITVIESLRAYDLVYITSGGNTVLPGLEMLSMLVTEWIIGQTQRIGYGSALAVVLLLVSLVPICIFLYTNFREEDAA
ncbi:carbohydrate ABC transporter permease [Rudaeicoccus suwonensis]|uniref:Carbohydrate ABC transporter membrane protein 1 (CUT1 family) n=1 Tax=Rudaeicoccus suwonensis TaxID=657409 RepID=A0A561DVA7_9MICO|nr:sugar ABC transporter permease [Rudaeicoccus suwonensis]TWE07295.1 carbohydrate ABC transporter membrane protein 1 (CUT1 family) [Rudaeicoccus suwonensis]